VRLERDYGWRFVTLYGAWWLELWTMRWGAVVGNAAVGPVPGGLSIAIATLMLMGAGIVAARARPVLPGRRRQRCAR